MCKRSKEPGLSRQTKFCPSIKNGALRNSDCCVPNMRTKRNAKSSSKFCALSG